MVEGAESAVTLRLSAPAGRAVVVAAILKTKDLGVGRNGVGDPQKREREEGQSQGQVADNLLRT